MMKLNKKIIMQLRASKCKNDDENDNNENNEERERGIS